MKKRRSLTGQLTLFISLSLLIIWIISVFSTTYVSLRQERHRLIESLSHDADLRAALTNLRFEGAERDALALVKLYQLFHRIPWNGSTTNKNEALSQPINTGPCTFKGVQDRNFIEAYGTSGENNYLDSFILDRRYGISLLPPHTHAPDYFFRRQVALQELQLKATHDQLYWGTPKYISGNGWTLSVAAACSQGSLAGLSIKLSNLLSFANPVSGRDINLWLDDKNHILPFSPLTDQQTQKLQVLLKNITPKEGWQQIPGYLMLRSQLQGPGWQQIILYPTHGVVDHAFSIAVEQLPFALTILSLLSITLFWLLHRHLAKPLRDFVDIIDKTSPDPLALRLPENRHDELGSIAHAYNMLLDTLSAQHDNLENRIAERTRDLTAAKQQAEQANKRKSSHLTTISHELRTPLSGALGALELLQMTDMTEKQSGMTETARQCTLSLLDIINNLLDFSRIESGQLSLYVEQTALLPILDQAMHTIQGPGQRKGLVLRTYVGEHVPLHIDVDGLRLRQILVNLLGNAVKFTEKGGISLNVKRRDRQLEFAVSDSGKGIASVDRTAVFAPFYQSQGHIPGTGLGLTIASNLAQMMGGWLELSSTPGLGTCISFLLPLGNHVAPSQLVGKIAAPQALHRQLLTWGIRCQTTQKQTPFCADELNFLPGKLYALLTHNLSGNSNLEPDTVPVQPWRLHILLIDDAVVNRNIIGAMLVALGQNVVTVASGDDALVRGQHQRFDLVLMDIHMPEMDGLTCTRHWRRDKKNHDRHCMIIALSAHAAQDEVSRCKDAGIQLYLTKPVTMAHLANAISIAAEHQLRRDIPLQEQSDKEHVAILSLDDPIIRLKIYQSLSTLLSELDQHLNNPQKTATLLHTLKGCIGQSGLELLLCDVLDMENHVKQGLPLSREEITVLRHKLEVALCSKNLAGRTMFYQEGMDNERT